MLKNDLAVYKERWVIIDAIQREERKSAPLSLRWQQLNSAYGMAKGLGLLQPDPSEIGVFQRWAKLKEIYESHHPAS